MPADSDDPLAGQRDQLRSLAARVSEWAGIPMPLDDERLVVEPHFPAAPILREIGREDGLPDNCARVRNTFWSTRWRSMIVVLELVDAKVTYRLAPAANQVRQLMHTLRCSDAWGLEQESTAVEMLSKLITARQFKQYILTGTFLEESPRSGLFYMFRRLRPTIAIKPQEPSSRILCTLCLHPIAYYEGTWAGAMCPTDDVIAHLMLMRGDEVMFWRRSNQHSPSMPQAGI